MFRKKLNTKALRVFFYYTIILVIFIIVSIITAALLKSRTLYLINLRFYVLVEFFTFTVFFNYLITSIKIRRFILFANIPFILFCIYDYVSDTHKFSNYPVIIEFLVFILVIVYYFFELMKNSLLVPVYQSISFWICVGLFLYFTGNFFLMTFSGLRSLFTFVDRRTGPTIRGGGGWNPNIPPQIQTKKSKQIIQKKSIIF